MSVLVTKVAPDFTAQAVMPDNQIKEITLSSYRGKYVVLFFYPLDFTFVCPSEILAFNKAVKVFEKKGAIVLGVSVDSQFVSVRPTPSSAFPRGRDLFEISGLHRLPVSRKEFFQVVIGVVHDPPQHIL